MGKKRLISISLPSELIKAMDTFLNQKQDILGISIPVKYSRNKFIEDAIREKLTRDTDGK